MRGMQPWIERNRLAIAGNGVARFAPGFKDMAEVEMEFSPPWLQLHGPHHQPDGNVGLASLVGQEPGEVKRVGVFRFRLEDLRVQLFRFAELAFLVMAEGTLNKAGGR